jgi:hypothetical protein
MESYTCFEAEGSIQEDGGTYRYGIVCLTCIGLSNLIDCKTAYSDACKTSSTLPVRTTVLLKMNPRLPNM